ncbi:hypothetical protein PoB_006181200 [Plakobranchus ocellatus]|uniref:Uncharacterized protein n=1 Tax=Plakobranchus ocellatus TaxID=259542 RepID=A0AAV4CTS5_9GAST|nr:hypothetical protein PoB_006181200 [Plakobranchus ocellatus]
MRLGQNISLIRYPKAEVGKTGSVLKPRLVVKFTKALKSKSLHRRAEPRVELDTVSLCEGIRNCEDPMTDSEGYRSCSFSSGE